MKHEKELSEAVDLVRKISEFKQASPLGCIGLDAGHLQVRDCRIFGVPVVSEYHDPKYPVKLSFTYNGIQVMSIHRKEEVQ